MTDKDLQNISAAEYIIKRLNERDDDKRRINFFEKLYLIVVTVLVTVFVIGFRWFEFKLAVAKWWGNWL